MTYQNIMIDDIKKLIMNIDCGNCCLRDSCKSENLICTQIIEWLNEQYS